ncbi:MAG TPA: CHASE3 domain-containing protein, partial [Chloroflexia bacterium]|nr:CHASE3 domain-containing protein [Chloroflexia bacterium]
MKLPFQKSIVLTLGLITFALIVVGFIFYLTTTNFISDSDWVTHTHKVVEQIEATYGGIKDAESAERSYLLTGDKDYLVSFTTAVNSINSSEQELRALTLDNSLQQQRVDSLGHLLDARIKLLTASIDLYNTQGLSAVQENIKLGQGKQIVEQINTVIAQLNTEERRLLDERTTNVHNSAQTFTFVFLILIAVVFSLLSFVFVLLRRDARERRQSEKLLRTQRELTANLIQNSAVATVGLDTDHKVIVWNKAAEELTGLKAEEVIGTGNHWKGFYNQQRPTLNDILIDGSFELLPEYYDTYAEQSILSTEALHAEAWFNNLGGKRRFVVFDAAPVFDSEGKMLAAITTLQDFTEHKKVEEAMREGEKRFRTLVQNMQVGVLVQGPKAEILINNQAALDLLEVTQDQLLGRSSFDPDWRTIAEDGSDLPGDKHPVPVAIATKQPVKNAVMGVWRPHTFTWGWLLVNAVPQLDAEGEVTQVICTFTDITDRKNVERMKNEFISTVSHELRTPLTSIRGSLGLLIGGIAGDLPSQARSMIEIAHKNSERLVRLINDILDIEKIESGKMVLQR